MGTTGPPLEAVAVLAEIAGELEPAPGDRSHPPDPRRRRLIARRLAVTAIQAAASVHGVFGDRPGLEVASNRAVALVMPRARVLAPGEASPGRALGAVAAAALALPPLYDDGHADWQVGAIAFVDEHLLRTLYFALLQLAAVALCEAAHG